MAEKAEENKNDDTNVEESENNESVDEKMEEFKRRTDEFEKNVVKMPVAANSIFSGDFKPKDVCENMARTYPFCHGGILSVAYYFLCLKKKYGSKVEKEVYANMKMHELFDRIAKKRAVVFYQSYDSFMLRDHTKSSGDWEQVGKNNEEEFHSGKLRLKDYMSYDEMLLSSVCGLSSPTHFINDGDRRNGGRKSYDPPYKGIYMGLIGARFEKTNVMEHQLMIITEEQNRAQLGYGGPDPSDDTLDPLDYTDDLEEELKDNFIENKYLKGKKLNENKPLIHSIYETFYSCKFFPEYKQINKNKKKNKNNYYEKTYGWSDDDDNPYLDLNKFKRRIRISLELFLFDADRRASKVNTKAYCHLVGLGAGYWSFKKSIQDRTMVAVVKDILNDGVFDNLSCVYFAWFEDNCNYLKEDFDEDDPNEPEIFAKTKEKQEKQDKHFAKDKNGTVIDIKFGRRNPADKLVKKKYKKDLLCAMYAWDGNSYPGNEYYYGLLSASGDPAAASCSTIPYLQNAQINGDNVNGENTAFYFVDPTTGKYQFVKLKDMNFEKDPKKWLRKSILSIPYKRNNLIKNLNNEINDKKENDK